MRLLCANAKSPYANPAILYECLLSRARNKNRELEKYFSGVIYNISPNHRDFAEIRNAAKNAMFSEKGRPLTTSAEPPANFYNTELLSATNLALSNAIDAMKKHPVQKRLKSKDALTIVKNEFSAARIELNKKNLTPEDMFCSDSVKRLKSTINATEKQFLSYYSKRGLSK
jgi:hypothetical protein